MAGRSSGGASGGRSRSGAASQRKLDAGSRRARLTAPGPDERPTLRTPIQGPGRSPDVPVLSRPERQRFELVRELGPVAVVLALAVVVLAGLAVLPARTWWTQRQSLHQSRAELAQVEQDVADLKARQELLQTDAEVERLARQDYDLVFPGEESYRLVPADATPAPALNPAGASGNGTP